MIPRLSQRSKRFRKSRFFTGGFFGAFDSLLAQETEDPPRLESVGAYPAKIQVTGSIKYDYEDDAPSSRAAEFRELTASLGVKDGAPILLAGSTFPGEEKTLVQLFCDLRAEFPGLFLILVPRHVERIPEILDEIKPFGLKVALRSRPENNTAADCLIVDTTGELRDWYHLGTVIFVGKSLYSHGGQNPVEAAVARKPVILGPHMENFINIVKLLVEHHAAIQVPDVAGT